MDSLKNLSFSFKVQAKSDDLLFETQDERQLMLRRYCEREQPQNKTIPLRGFYYDKKQKVIYCRIGKVGCTMWKRLFLFFQGDQKTLMEVPKYEVWLILFNIMQMNHYSVFITRKQRWSKEV